jgi:hypothetical protein
VVASGVVTLARVALPPPDAMTGRTEAVAAWAFAAVLVGVNELVAQWLVRRPQPAASTAELVLRNDLTGDMLGTLSAYSLPALVIMALGLDYPLLALHIGFALMMVPVALDGTRRRRVREHIWRVPAG